MLLAKPNAEEFLTDELFDQVALTLTQVLDQTDSIQTLSLVLWLLNNLLEDSQRGQKLLQKHLAQQNELNGSFGIINSISNKAVEILSKS